MRPRIAPSILSADFSRLGEEIREVEAGGADLIHLDIMDGHFVPNLTFGPPVVRWLARHTALPLDAHLMVTEPDALVPGLVEAGVVRIAIHAETCPHLQRSLAGIRDRGASPGLALNPATPLVFAEEAAPWIDFVLVMSVNPGFGGQRFIAGSLPRIERLHRSLGSQGVEIAVDGGITPRTAPGLAAAGVTTFIAGSAVFAAPDRARAIQEIREAALQGGRT